MSLTGDDFLAERRFWLRIETVDRPNGGWDVVLRIDGTYSGEDYATKAEMVAFFTDRLAAALRSAGPARL